MKNQLRRIPAVLGVIVATVYVAAGEALAQTTDDPTGGAAENMLNSIKGWITAHGVPLVVGLLVIGAIIGVLIKFGKRGAKAA